MNELTVLIADDEPLLRFHLHKMLQSLWPEVDTFIMAANGDEAWTEIEARRPQVVFLDIKMPGLSGVEVAARMQAEGLTRDCALVFLTAYDEYAVEAFQREALDYVLKPVDEMRLTQTVERLRDRLDKPDPMVADLTELSQWMRSARSDWLKWINAQRGEDIHVIDVDSVLLFRAEDKYTTVVSDSGDYLIRKSLKQLEAELDPNRFWRVHRSVIVRVDAISRVGRDLAGGQKVHLRGLQKPLPVSRRFAERFKQM